MPKFCREMVKKLSMSLILSKQKFANWFLIFYKAFYAIRWSISVLVLKGGHTLYTHTLIREVFLASLVNFLIWSPSISYNFYIFQIFFCWPQFKNLRNNLKNSVFDNQVFGIFKKMGLGVFLNFTRFRKFKFLKMK